MINEHDIKDMWPRKHPPQMKPQKDLRIITANSKQIGGDHYKQYGNLQPWDVVIAWNMDYLTGTALKYLARWHDKGGIADLEKAIHFIEKKIEVEKNKNV